MPARKSKIFRPDRLSHRLVKAANALNSVAELQAELTVAVQDAAQALIRLAEELPQERDGKAS